MFLSGEASGIAAPSFQARGSLHQPVDDEIDADGQCRRSRRPGSRAADMPKMMPSLLSLTMPPQSAAGGWMPRPRKERVERNRIEKAKRRPNSASSGDSVFGRISRKMIQTLPSPRRPRRLDELHHRDIERDRAADAEDAGRVEHGHDEDQDPEMLRQHRQHDEGEDQRRDRHHQIVEAGEELVDEPARDCRGEGQDHAEREGQARLPPAPRRWSCGRRRSGATAGRGRDCRCRAGSRRRTAARCRRRPRARRRGR